MISPLQLIQFGAACVSVACLANCSTTAVSLDYRPGLAQTVPGPKCVASGRFGDIRREDPYVLGVIRTPVGTPLERVATTVPVEEVVKNSFAYGLKTRHMLAPKAAASYVVTGEIIEFYVQQVVRPYAYARIRVNLLAEGSGRLLHSRIYQAERSGGMYLPGTGSPVPNLRELASRALQDVVDHALDDVSLRARIVPPHHENTTVDRENSPRGETSVRRDSPARRESPARRDTPSHQDYPPGPPPGSF